MIAGVVLAAAVAGGVGWWLSSPSKTYFDNPEVRSATAEVVRAASPAADPEQVRRAYEEFGLVYANSGVDGLARFTESCAQSLQADGRILDFCLAFDMFAGTVAQAAEPPGKAEARRIALVQAALPGADPDARIAEVQRLMRQASGMQTASVPETPAPAVAAPSTAPAPAKAAPIRLAKAAAPPPKARSAGGACRLQPTPADRLLCANPTLKIQERRMKDAYERALAAGADPLVIDRGQAEWRAMRNAADTRAELADLYARRTRELSEAAETAARTPPS
ncbi:hypothetical protein [Phenylobacterium sp.]|uniref:hypothetical protein n=1 Tax=Phenylobacterium sp. TaxID=1871053 RepID=UPI002812645F|nr:hypothetical protein [Phenylobacterium sp.]